MTCFDNYYHAYGSAAIKLDRNTNMQLMNVTVGGLSIMATPFPQTFLRSRSGMDVPSVPTRRLDLDKYRNVLLDNLEASLIRCNQDLSRPFAYFEKSRVVRERIQTVP